MLLFEPQRTEFDLNFNLLGFNVRVCPWFWIMALLLGARAGSSAALLIWVAVVFISILVHELGHTLAFRYYGTSSHIVLYQFGGLAVPDDTFRGFGSGGVLRPAQQIIVSLAGPMAGFLLAAFTVAVVYATGERVIFYRAGRFFFYWQLSSGFYGKMNLVYLVDFLLQVNIFWGIINLLPIYPLDGGKVSRELFLLNDYRDGVRKSLILSIAAAAAIAVYALSARQFYLGIMFGFLGFSSYQMLRSYTGGGFGGGNPW